MGFFANRRKRRALAIYVRQVGPFLSRQYGASKTYTPQQIEAAIEHCNASLEYLPYAYVLFLSKEDFAHFASLSANSQPAYDRQQLLEDIAANLPLQARRSVGSTGVDFGITPNGRLWNDAADGSFCDSNPGGDSCSF
jgi:hypothetical protein